MNVTSQARRRSRLLTAAGLLGLLMLGACASTPPAPTASLQAARQAILEAERADAGSHARGELDEARTKLASADSAVREEKMVKAERLAEESRAGAGLATAMTAAAKANAVNEEMKRSNSSLVEEMRRSSGETP